MDLVFRITSSEHLFSYFLDFFIITNGKTFCNLGRINLLFHLLQLVTLICFCITFYNWKCLAYKRVRMPSGQEKFVCIGDLEGWGYSSSDIRGYLAALSILQVIFVIQLFAKDWETTVNSRENT